jgi:hypothetical protein
MIRTITGQRMTRVWQRHICSWSLTFWIAPWHLYANIISSFVRVTSLLLQLHYRLRYCAPYVWIDPSVPQLGCLRVDCSLLLTALPMQSDACAVSVARPSQAQSLVPMHMHVTTSIKVCNDEDERRCSVLFNQLLLPLYLPSSKSEANDHFPFLFSLAIIDRVASAYRPTEENIAIQCLRTCMGVGISKGHSPMCSLEAEAAAMLNSLSDPSPPLTSAHAANSGMVTGTASPSSSTYYAADSPAGLIRRTFGSHFLRPRPDPPIFCKRPVAFCRNQQNRTNIELCPPSPASQNDT